MSFVFRMNLSIRLNFYVFQLMHAAKNLKKMFIINEMITTLIIEKKRFDYEKNENNKTLTMKIKKMIKTLKNQSINQKKKVEVMQLLQKFHSY